jgi:signal transduction histidine kinase
VPQPLWIILGVGIGLLSMMPVLLIVRRRAVLQAREAERRARRSERLAELGSMTGGLAHEIKNPLSTIGLNAQLLAEAVHESDLPDDERQRMIRRIDGLRREVERLRGILTDFLQFAGRIRLDPQPHDLAGVVDELSDFFHPQCDQAGILLRTQGPGRPAPVRIDEGLFKQALLNLMVNATQAMQPRSGDPAHPHERRGELMLRVAVGANEATVHVIDTGPGIEPDQLEEIFHPYVSHKAGGTGLGLPTARRIIEEHGGRLVAHSVPGQGSEFVIHLPLATNGSTDSTEPDR